MSDDRTPKTIVYVIPAYPPAPSQPFVVNEMIEIARAGHRLVVLPLYRAPGGAMTHGTYAALRPDRVLEPRLLTPGILWKALKTLVRHPALCLRVLGGLHRAAGRNPWAHAKLLAVTPKALAAAGDFESAPPDRIHAHFANQTADCAAIVGEIAHVPFSFTAHAYDIYSRRPRLRNETLSWKLERASRAFAVSQYGVEILRRALPAAEGRLATAYVGIPLDLFRWVQPRVEDGPIRLLCVARLTEKKGIDVLLDACAILRDRGEAFACDVIGDGPLREDLERQHAALELGDCVRLRRGVAQEAVAAALRDADVFVMPCRQDQNGDMDGIPTVFMEAMATGRPVVSCAVSGVPELVRSDETGIVVPVNDAKAVADAVQRLARDPDLRLRLAQAGRALVEEQHDQRRTAKRVLRLLLERDGARC